MAIRRDCIGGAVWVCAVVGSVALGACSGKTPVASSAATGTIVTADAQAAQGDVIATGGDEGVVAIDLGANDVPGIEVTLACPGAAGCTCGQSSECESGFCLDTQAGKLCAQKCIDTCPTGLVCAQVPGAGGDLVSICVEKFGHLCDPCTASSQCVVAGQADPRCVSYGKIGAFCGSACGSDADCGEAYACKKVPTVEGTTAQQCVRKAIVADDLGICPCSKRAVNLGLATTCFVDHKGTDGKVSASCAGQRACLAVGIDGLAACAAAPPGAEVCDGKDNDCDGVTDEVSCDDGNACTTDACSPGAPAAGVDGCTHIAQVGLACDDKDPCTAGSVCDKVGACGAGKNECECAKNSDCLPKEDGDACNGSLICDQSALPYKCKVDPASIVACDSAQDTACATSACDKATGKCALLPKAASTVCDDGDACTVGDNCQSGTCTAGTTICQCQNNADCASKEDGNLCNGTLYCDKSSFPFVCSVNLATVVVCSTAGDSGCSKNTCTPKTGQCAISAAENGTACDADGNKCTIGDACQAGACVAGENLCDCKTASDCTSKEDGDLCNGTLFCNKAKGKCEVNPQSVVSCPTASDTACTKSQCDKGSGACKMQAVPDKTPCFDGSLCTTGDVCQVGSCVGSASTCTCQSDADCAGKDDGDLCNGTLFCDKTKGTCQLNPATIVSCPNVNDTVCMANQCEKKTGKCQMTPTKNVCEDGNPCTANDACANGLCQPGANACPCATTDDCKAKEDSNLCNGTLVCNKALGACLVDAETIVTCPKDKDTTCQKSVCAAATGTCGLYAVNQGVACSDGESCTQGEFCQMGLCSGGINICPCQADSDCIAKDDGDLCNGVLACNKALLPGPGCLYDPASVVACSKSADSPCLQNQCGKTTGLCKMTAVAGACSDGEPCTVDDYCSDGNCLSGKNTCPCLVAGDCDDKIACTTDSCDKAKGCSHGAIDGLCDDGQVCTADSCDVAKGCLNPPVNAPCSDGNVCTQTDACSLGVCVGSKPLLCGDGNTCTDDSCDKGKGCVNLANTATCSDNSVCTLSDACTATVCKAGLAADCGDGDACTKDQCDAAKGCNWPVVACDDKVACTADSCDKQSGCANLPQDASCVDVNPCTDDACDKVKGCVNLANAATCSDGDACTTGEACTGKACLPSGALDCNDKNVCTNDSCDKVTGCLNLAVTVTTSCDDASVCTTVDLCVGGNCAGGVPKVCGDGNPCASGGCDAKTGCVATPAPTGAPCSDGDACTKGDNCANGKCLPGAATTCDDANACTADSCDKASGCKFTANTAACTDNNACTTGDVCAAGVCKPGATPVVCDDGNKCTVDACDKVKGCLAPAAADGIDCGTSATCKAGVCVGAGKAVLVVAGDHHACVVTSIGGVACWGRNQYGQLGDGTLVDRYNPTPVALPAPASSVAAGRNYTCALLKTGAVYCWGYNASGQLGNGNATSQKAPVAVTGLTSGVKAITAGDSHSCAITSAGGAKCWGHNGGGQLGTANTTSTTTPVAVKLLDSGVTAIAAGWSHTCAVAFDGLTFCWGLNSSGQLGNGTKDNKLEPEILPSLPGPTAALYASDVNTCAVATDGALTCWGGTAYQKMPASYTVPTKQTGPVLGVALNVNNACSLLTSGKVYCRGSNSNGQLGNGVFDSNAAGFADTLVPLASAAKSIAVGTGHACAVLASGDVQCWGYNLYGSVGIGQPSYLAQPKAVVSLPAAVNSAATGGAHTCATLADGTVWCWGYNNYKQTGQAAPLRITKPAQTALTLNSNSVSKLSKQMSVGAAHSCATMAAGEVVCWGDNGSGRLGTAYGQPVSPVVVSALGGPALSVSAGGAFSCARLEGGSVQCWGANDVGQLGMGAANSGGATPQTAAGITNPSQLATGANFACALVSGAVKCWGGNASGQVGNGATATNVLVPAQAVGLASGVSAVVAGDSHACAVLDGGALKCWGANASGQVGSGSGSAAVNSPAQVTGLASGVVAVAAGSAHTCALLDTGAVKCWGLNSSGQIGDFTTVSKNVPAQSFGLTSGVVAIAAGGNTSCALLATGAVKCWGANGSGQFGDGSTTQKSIASAGVAISGINKLALGANYGCALTDAGSVQCWGAGDKYQMGDASSAAVNLTPHTVGVTIGSAGLALGGVFSAMVQQGNLLQWGVALSKVTYVTCTGSPSCAPNYESWVPSGSSPNPVVSALNISRVAAGSAFVCAVTAASGAVCAGEGTYRELGGILPSVVSFSSYWNSCYLSGYPGYCFSPTSGFIGVTGLGSGVQAVSAGSYHACALTKAGAVHCWGHNWQGQVGFGVPAQETNPGAVTGLSSGVVAISAGGSHTCALLDTTGVKCWGWNKYGQIGDTTYTDRVAPTPVTGLSSGVVSIHAAGIHTCAQMSAGGVKCWGYNGTGQLSDGTIVDKAKPTDVVGLPADASSIAAGSGAGHTCAVLKDGSLRCWGQNFDGQIGDGAPLTHTPAYVVGFTP